MPHLYDLIDAAIFLAPVLAAAVGLAWWVLGVVVTRAAGVR